jgi:hypothetical protein
MPTRKRFTSPRLRAAMSAASARTVWRWCANTLTVEGSNEAIDQFVQVGTRGDTPLAAVVQGVLGRTNALSTPVGKELWRELTIERLERMTFAAHVESETISESRRPTPSGIKADIFHDVQIVECELERLRISFGTIADPPVSWLSAVHRAHPRMTLTLAYDDPENENRGILRAGPGDMTGQVTIPYGPADHVGGNGRRIVRPDCLPELLDVIDRFYREDMGYSE